MFKCLVSEISLICDKISRAFIVLLFISFYFTNLCSVLSVKCNTCRSGEINLLGFDKHSQLCIKVHIGQNEINISYK